MSIKTDIERIKDEEARIQFDHFNHDLAYRIGVALHEEAQTQGVSVTVDVRAFGQQIFHLAMAGTSPDNDRWIEGKIRVVKRFHKSSLRVGRELAAEKLSIEDRFFVDPFEFRPFGGCFPVRLKQGGVIGTVTVSGLTQEEDHALAVSVLERFVSA
jgi:uncharacterized protein (UPF0303 family)